MDGRPPPFGALVSVLPVAQSRRRGEWEMTLVSVERWDTCWAANVALQGDPPPSRTEWLNPLVDLEAVDDRGGRYRAGFGGGSGGGRRDGGQDARFLVTFAPALDPEAGGVRLSGRLRLYRSGGASGQAPQIAWEDPDPWVFSVSLSGVLGAPLGATGFGVGDEPGAFSPECGPELVRLRRVVPVVAEQAGNGWTVTWVAAELYDGGVRLNVRLLGPVETAGLPELGPRVTDERVTEYRVWSGDGGGIWDENRFHWRQAALVAPAPDAGVRELRVAIDEVRMTDGEPDPAHPGMHRLVIVERIPVACTCVVDLR